MVTGWKILGNKRFHLGQIMGWGRRIKKPVKGIASAMFIMMLWSVIPSVAEQYWVYTIRPGDNIWDLTQRHSVSVMNWRRIQELNNIPDIPALRMQPGTMLRFPISLLKYQPASATVVSMVGEAVVSSADNGGSRPVRLNMALNSGDKVSTLTDSRLLIRFADGSEMWVQAESTLTMDTLSAYGSTGMVDTQVRLKSGQVESQVKPARGTGSRYEIITPAAVAAVRGTGFRVSTEEAGSLARVEVLEGEVLIINDSGSTAVGPGFGVVAERGSPPGAAISLLPPPELNTVDVEQNPLAFTWQALAGAQNYRFQISQGSQFKSILVDEITSTHRAEWQGLSGGQYLLRVRGIDAQGLEGMNAQLSFTLDGTAIPGNIAAASLLSPPIFNRVTVSKDKIAMDWLAVSNARTYRYQLSNDPEFQDLMYEGGVDRSAVVLHRPADGRYYFRVQSVDGSGAAGPFGTGQLVTVNAESSSHKSGSPSANPSPLVLLVPLLF